MTPIAASPLAGSLTDAARLAAERRGRERVAEKTAAQTSKRALVSSLLLTAARSMVSAVTRRRERRRSGSAGSAAARGRRVGLGLDELERVEAGADVRVGEADEGLDGVGRDEDALVLADELEALLEPLRGRGPELDDVHEGPQLAEDGGVEVVADADEGACEDGGVLAASG
jgi:hypothetical protein